MKTTFRANPGTSAGLRQPANGFTLIELLVTISIGALLMVVAVPSFVSFQKNAQLSETVSNFIAATNAARANAMKQGVNTYLVPNSGTNWGSGWMVFTDINWNQTYDVSTEAVILSHESPDSSISITIPSTSSFSSGYVLFNGSGYPRLKNGGFGGGTLVMNNGTRSSSNIIDPAGRTRSCTTGSTGC